MNESLFSPNLSEDISENRSEEDNQDAFEKAGGKIRKWDDSGKPTEWICGTDSQGNFIHPPGIKDKDVIIHLAVSGKNPDLYQNCFIGKIPNQEDIKNMNQWI